MRTHVIGTFAAAAALVLSAGITTASSAMPVPLDIQDSPAAAASHDVGQVAAARAATRQFHSGVRARQHGYALFRDVNGIACIAMPHMGGMGVHYVNSDLVGSPEVRLRHPEALVYARSNGHRHLVALEYLVLRKDWRKAHGPQAHRPRLFGHRFDLTPGGNRFGLPAFYSLHAWIWKHNPAGRFAMWNPDVRCGP